MTNIKVIELIGEKPGKTTVLLAGIHGNETNGVKAFDKIVPNIKIESGKVVFIYANLQAIIQNKRQIEKNLNRCFLKQQPEDIINTLEGKTAKEIMPYLDSADFMLDIHSSFIEDSMPFVICDEKQIKNSIFFDSEIVSYNWDPFEPGSTDYYMNQLEKPGFCLECGYLNDNKSSEIAERAIYNFLIFTKNIQGKIFVRKDKRYLKIRMLYKNKLGSFKKRRYLKDFQKADEDMIIGYDGLQPIFIKKDDIVLFLRDVDDLNEECFLIAEEITKETLINKQNQFNIEKRGKLIWKYYLSANIIYSEVR